MVKKLLVKVLVVGFLVIFTSTLLAQRSSTFDPEALIKKEVYTTVGLTDQPLALISSELQTITYWNSRNIYVLQYDLFRLHNLCVAESRMLDSEYVISTHIYQLSNRDPRLLVVYSTTCEIAVNAFPPFEGGRLPTRRPIITPTVVPTVVAVVATQTAVSPVPVTATVAPVVIPPLPVIIDGGLAVSVFDFVCPVLLAGETGTVAQLQLWHPLAGWQTLPVTITLSQQNVEAPVEGAIVFSVGTTPYWEGASSGTFAVVAYGLPLIAFDIVGPVERVRQGEEHQFDVALCYVKP